MKKDTDYVFYELTRSICPKCFAWPNRPRMAMKMCAASLGSMLDPVMKRRGRSGTGAVESVQVFAPERTNEQMSVHHQLRQRSQR